VNIPRVAFFADSFHEVNGAALTCRAFAAYAKRRGYPFLSVRSGSNPGLRVDGEFRSLELRRGPMTIPIDRDLGFDPAFFRHRARVLTVLREFAPDLIHITSPGDLGILGAWCAYTLGLPMVASWHTNVHEFAARRLQRYAGSRVADVAERFILRRVLRFYRLARLTLAPNDELVALLGSATRKPAFLMTRGIDTTLFSQARRARTDGVFTMGFVGRLNAEKNVRFLLEIERTFLAAGAPPFRFLVVGDGAERSYLQSHLKHAEFPGVLRGEALASAYANMDLFVFPSRTDTFGNVILEAMASGVPAIVTAHGGPKFLVEHGVTGMIASDEPAFLSAALALQRDPERRAAMSAACTQRARQYSWERVFEAEVYESYRICLATRAVGLPAYRGERSSPGQARA
jgi:phosphatidylinositol alpha 1,6-mannosyltransferase